MKGKYDKLVRDKIPEIMISEGFKPKFKKLNIKEYRIELNKKFKEEVSEFIESKNKDSMIQELADVQEVLLAIYKEYKLDCSEISKVARLKRKKKGGFEKKIFIETVE